MSDLISRQAAIDALRAMQTYKLFAGDDMLLIDQAGAQTELMLLPPIQPVNCSEFPNNSDTISRQAAIDAMAELQGSTSSKGVLKGISKAWKRIEQLPPIQPEPHWIPVTESLPKEDGNYLVSGKWGSGKESVGDCEFSVEDGYFQTAWNFDVLAWCNLPEPYKGVTE